MKFGGVRGAVRLAVPDRPGELPSRTRRAAQNSNRSRIVLVECPFDYFNYFPGRYGNRLEDTAETRCRSKTAPFPFILIFFYSSSSCSCSSFAGPGENPKTRSEVAATRKIVIFKKGTGRARCRRLSRPERRIL